MKGLHSRLPALGPPPLPSVLLLPTLPALPAGTNTRPPTTERHPPSSTSAQYSWWLQRFFFKSLWLCSSSMICGGKAGAAGTGGGAPGEQTVLAKAGHRASRSEPSGGGCTRRYNCARPHAA